MKYKKGDRVELSREGIERLYPDHADRKGTIIGRSTQYPKTCTRVLWDGRKSAETISIDFIE